MVVSSSINQMVVWVEDHLVIGLLSTTPIIQIPTILHIFLKGYFFYSWKCESNPLFFFYVIVIMPFLISDLEFV